MSGRVLRTHASRSATVTMGPGSTVTIAASKKKETRARVKKTHGNEEQDAEPGSVSEGVTPSLSRLVEPTPETVDRSSNGNSTATLTTDSTLLLRALTAMLQSSAATTSSTPSDPVPAPRHSPRHGGLRFIGLTSYRGEPGDSLESWIAQVSLRHEVHVLHEGASEALFVASAATMLSDAAVTWWLSLPHSSRPTTWDTMKDALRQQFQPVTTAELARDQLMELRQSPSQSVVEYASCFRRLLALAGESDFPPRFLAERFTKGLYDTATQRDIRAAALSTLIAVIERATRLDGHRAPTQQSCAAASTTRSEDRVPSEHHTQHLEARITELEALVHQLRRERGQPTDRHSTSNTVSTPDPRRHVPGLSVEEARFRMDNRRCLYCGRSGHVIRECTDRAGGKTPTLA